MDWKINYHKWNEYKDMDQELRLQLNELTDQPTQLEDRFYKSLEFGTGGIRGEIGPGTNRINIYMIRKAAEGLARYIEREGQEAKARGVVIAYDSRFKSPEFAMEAAKTLGHHGIRTYVFESLRSTPVLSFAVRYLRAHNGIVITASHNPPEYNGFKVYGQDGAQILPDVAEQIVAMMDEIDNELTIKVSNESTLIKSSLLTMIGEEVDEAYLNQLKKMVIHPEIIKQVSDDFKIVYTPLHGTGNLPVREGLRAIGFNNIQVVKEQEMPDANFSTVTSPNPEEHAAFELAIQYGEKYHADILLGTDPDADRVGVAVKNTEGKYEVLTGNQVGALLLHYLITEKKKTEQLPKDATVLKTIVTSEIGRDIASAHGLETIDTLTGFKFIGAKIREFEETGHREFLFGYEESYGYLMGDFVRDKDAIQACLLIAEVAAYYKAKHLTLYEALLLIFDAYGYYAETLESLTLKGKEGIDNINAILADFRSKPPLMINDKRVLLVEDYQKGRRNLVLENREEEILLPQSNVLKYKLEDGSWFCLRPSGTEPKLKLYFGVKESTMNASQQQLEQLKDAVMIRVHSLVKK